MLLANHGDVFSLMSGLRVSKSDPEWLNSWDNTISLSPKSFHDTISAGFENHCQAYVDFTGTGIADIDVYYGAYAKPIAYIKAEIQRNAYFQEMMIKEISVFFKNRNKVECELTF